MKGVEDVFGVGDAKRVALKVGRLSRKEGIRMNEVDRRDKPKGGEEGKRKRKEAERAP
jgi:hypothetical protein